MRSAVTQRRIPAALPALRRAAPRVGRRGAQLRVAPPRLRANLGAPPAAERGSGAPAAAGLCGTRDTHDHGAARESSATARPRTAHPQKPPLAAPPLPVHFYKPLLAPWRTYAPTAPAAHSHSHTHTHSRSPPRDRQPPPLSPPSRSRDSTRRDVTPRGPARAL